MPGFLRGKLGDLKTPCDFFSIQAYFGRIVPGWVLEGPVPV